MTSDLGISCGNHLPLHTHKERERERFIHIRRQLIVKKLQEKFVCLSLESWLYTQRQSDILMAVLMDCVKYGTCDAIACVLIRQLTK